MRYIDADECLDAMLDEMAGTGYQDRAMSVIKYAPTADVVEVVRCKDCKHYDGSSCGEIAYIMDGYYLGTFELKKPTDFCSYGERI